jgi:hypothetical protein
MAQMANAQSVALQLEKVRDKLPLLYERDDILLTMIQQRGDVERVSSRNMRLPLQIRPGGKAGAANMDGGDLGRGSGTTYDVAQVTPVFFRHAVEITKLVEYATNAPEKAIENAARREVKNAMAQFRSFLDKVLQTAGNGVLATVASVAGNQLNLVNPPGATLVYFNQTVQIYDATLTTNRGAANITLVDPFNKFITLDSVPAGTTAGDLIVHDGLSGANPTSLFGVPYHHSSATTGTWLGLNRASYPVELATPSVNAANAALVPSHVRLAINRVRKALGTNQVGRLIAYCSLEQEHAWEQLGVSISQIIKEGPGGGANDLDLLFNGQKTMAGVPIKSSINARADRIDFIDLGHWGRAVMQDIDYYEVGGQTVFPIYGSSGGLASAYIFYFVTGFQVFVDAPRSGAYIYNLALPAGY